MGPKEKLAADEAGKVLAKDFTAWAKGKYKNQKPSFKQYLGDISKSPAWRSDWFGKFLGAVEMSFDKAIKTELK
jgi:hypothetical protein